MGQGKRALVTGGAGFIGSNLSAKLLELGVTVDCVDNLITGRLDAIRSLRRRDGFRFFKLDVSEPAFLRLALSMRYDQIYHLACPTGVPNIELLGEAMIRTCSAGTDQVLQVARAHDAKLVYASSAEVYGDPKVFPQDEAYCGNVDPVGPRSAYEEGKRFGESLVRLYARQYQVDAKIVRIFNTFGVGMRLDDSRVIPSFLRRIRDREAIVIYGDGQQTRTHLYVDDLVAALQLILELGGRGEVYNVGGEAPLTILKLAELLDEIISLPVRIEHAPHFIEDHCGRWPMTVKVRGLGWEPKISVRDGLRRMCIGCGLPVRAGAVIEAAAEMTPLGA